MLNFIMLQLEIRVVYDICQERIILFEKLSRDCIIVGSAAFWGGPGASVPMGEASPEDTHIQGCYQKAAEGPWLQPRGWMAQEASSGRTFPFA